MKLDTEFYKLPLRFDVACLAREASQFAEHEWKPHPQGYPGNSAISLLAVGGDPASDAVRGPMRPTPFLDRCPYMKQVLASLGAVLGRSRLMRISGQSEATAHVDTNYYWLNHVRVHIPAVTYPEVKFVCNDRELHMAAGETWIFDTWRLHNVINPVSGVRIHLVADTVGSASFWELVEQAERPFDPRPETTTPARFVPYRPGVDVELETEGVNFPVVMSPWEQRLLVTSMFEDLLKVENLPADLVGRLEATLERFHLHWRGLWARFGQDAAGFAAYRHALDQLDAALRPFENRLRLPNTVDMAEALRQSIVRPALNPDLAASGSVTTPAIAKPQAAQYPAGGREKDPVFDRPVFIVAAPRSGSSLLFETLARSPGFVTVGGESHEVFESIAKLQPGNRGWDSNRVTEADAATAAELRANFLSRLHDRNGQPPKPGQPFRMLEKTPKNALRIPLLNAVFPDALFIYLFREPNENLSSIIDAWRSGRFVTYPKLQGWDGPPWSLLLIPGWRDLKGKSLAEIAAAQWTSAHDHILNDLSKLPADRWCGVTYADLVADPQAVAQRLCAFAGVAWDDHLTSGELPLSRHTLTPPQPDKWKKNAAELEPVLPLVEAAAARVRAATSSQPPLNPHAAPVSEPKDVEPLRSVFTASMPEILDQLGISLLVTTYQAGKLIIVRKQDDQINTHFRTFPMPMGMALHKGRLSLGTKHHVWEFRNVPDVARRLEPRGKVDAAYLPRWVHMTGDIRIHEIAYSGDDELWVVNTRFSCLCTLDRDSSFVPRWRPPFVTALSPEDRCHLNGLAVVDGEPKYVTCLGATDTVGGWRENKRDGGLLLDVETGKTLLGGLSMPHSPRWHNGKLWILESGHGTLSTVDLKKGKTKIIAEMPGFTRGIDFVGHYAFIGLSQVRETATFSGIPIVEKLKERTCGVWVIDLHSGKTVGFVRFEGAVQEIFAVQALRGIRFPDLVTDDDEVLSNSFVLPQESMAEVPAGVGS